MAANMERRVVSKSVGPVSVQKRADGSSMLVGYGAVFFREGSPGTEYQLWDNVFERIAPTAFDRAIREKHDARGLFNHNPDNLLGRVSNDTMHLSVDSEGLRYEIGPLDSADPDHMRVLRKVERGDLSGSSFAFVPTNVTWEESADREIRTINDCDLYDTGPVTYPAYDGTSVGARSEQLVAEARSEHAVWKTQRDAAMTEGTSEAPATDSIVETPTGVTPVEEVAPASDAAPAADVVADEPAAPVETNSADNSDTTADLDAETESRERTAYRERALRLSLAN